MSKQSTEAVISPYSSLLPSAKCSYVQNWWDHMCINSWRAVQEPDNKFRTSTCLTISQKAVLYTTSAASAIAKPFLLSLVLFSCRRLFIEADCTWQAAGIALGKRICSTFKRIPASHCSSRSTSSLRVGQADGKITCCHWPKQSK